jgi:DNA-binding transcriptional MerR regulator
MVAQPSDVRNLRIYPNLAAAYSHVPAGYRMYTIAQYRAYHSQGRHYFTLNEIRPYCSGMSDRQIRFGLRQAVKAGLLALRDGVYRMLGRAAVMVQAGITNPGRAVVVPFTSDLTRFRANCYAAWLESRTNRTPSREALMNTWGVSRQTLQIWERLVGIKVFERIILIEVDPQTAGDPQAAAVAVSDERETYCTGRVWLSVVGPRGGIRAGRRLMDNDNTPLDDYWPMQDEPAWEPDCQIMLTWQGTNEYVSPLNRAASGRMKWLIKQADNLRGEGPANLSSHSGCESQEDNQPAKRHLAKRVTHPVKRFHKMADAVKWQSKRKGRDRPALVDTVLKGRIVSRFLPSHSVLWGET